MSSENQSPPLRSLKHRLRLALAWLLLGLPGLASAAPYTLGQGYPLPFWGLRAGGYFSAQASALEDERNRASLQDLSLFLHGSPSPDWHFFSEIELSNPIQLRDDGLTSQDVDLDVERLYVDHNLSTRMTLRAGKFLTPIGRWNLIHADPLVWTVSRPLTTSAAFAQNATGLQLYGSLPLQGSAIDYQLYVDDSQALDPSSNKELTFPDLSVTPNPVNAFRHGAGLRLVYHNIDDSLQIGVSLARFALQEQPDYQNLIGADLFYSYAGAEFSSEAIYRRDSGQSHRNEWGGFVQLAVPLIGHLYGVLNQERFKAAQFSQPVNSTSFGLTYRPVPPFSVKLERRESRGAEQLAPDGWLLSVGMLF